MNKKNIRAFSMSLILTILIVILTTSIATAEHTPNITIDPNIVPANAFLNFTVTLMNMPSSQDPIYEFRIYENEDFTNITCYPKEHWFGPFYGENVYGVYCEWNANSSSYEIQPGNSTDFHYEALTPSTECCRGWFMESKDTNNYWTNVTTDICIDTTPPNTTKTYGEPYYTNNGTEWISNETLITLTAVDPEPHPSGVNITYYAYMQLPNDYYCYSNCEDPLEGNGGMQVYTEPFNIPQESCHIIAFYSVDNVNNTEELKYQCVFVDTTPPTGDMQVGDPSISDEANESFYWVTPQTNITFTCEDQPPHPSEGEELCFKVFYDQPSLWTNITESYCNDTGGYMDGDYCCVNAHDVDVMFNFHNNEDSAHKIDYYCRDAVKNSNNLTTSYFKVDSTPPSIDKQMFGTWLGECPPQDENDTCYVKDNGSSGVIVNVQDIGNCHVNNVSCYYEVYWMNQSVDSGEFNNQTQITFYNDSTHQLYISCEDALGNTVDDWETFLVDSTPPETTKHYGEPFYSNEQSEWISSATPIWFTAYDEKSGVNSTYYMFNLVNDSYCYDPTYCNPIHQPGDENWTIYNGNNLTINEESCHLIEFYSVDNLGNVENVKSQCAFVDNTPPVMNKTIGEPKVVKEFNGENRTFITQETPITITCQDQQPHPVDHVSIYYRYRVSNDCENWNNWSDWTNSNGYGIVNKTIYFNEDSCHQIEYYCKDILGNANDVESEIDIVDNQPPNITKQVIGPQYGECPPQDENDTCYISNVTQILVDAVDPEPHPIGDVTCDWHYEVVGENISEEEQNVTPPFSINFPEQSRHQLWITCSDALGNEATDYEEFIVDNTPPETIKHYGEPFFSNESAEWISNLTPIWFNAYDQGPHPSGVANTYYRITMVDDQDCWDSIVCDNTTGVGDWQEYDNLNITIPEQSCHLIEYYSTDNVNNTEEINKQCTFVDTTPPVTNKTVGDPKEQWDGTDSQFYPWISQYCWNESQGDDMLECWKVTMTTPISLLCNDPEPHPVDNNHVCFNVELDGDDYTQEYCDYYNGNYNISGDGYCCLDHEVSDFLFHEETEHNLKYYCVDALGNTGSVDEEKFKVEGTSFEIPLFKKWNLISVPFVLFNDSPEAVFGNLQGIDSVWTYDPETSEWLVWTPDEAPDSLQHIQPGWGYWIFEKNMSESILIAGSLFQPGQLPPSRILKPGWNLIGYYGANWEQLEGMDDYEETCGQPWPGDYTYGSLAYCSLYSLMNLINGPPSALVSYVNCGDLSGGWVYLATCEDYDYMYAGRGYWVFLGNEYDSYEYAPSTNCIWNDNWGCLGSE